MSIGSRTVKGIFILATIYFFISNSLSCVAKHDWCCIQFLDFASKFACGAQFLYMQEISVNNSYLKLYPVSPVIKMIQASQNFIFQMVTDYYYYYFFFFLIVFALGGSPTPHPISSRPHFLYVNLVAMGPVHLSPVTWPQAYGIGIPLLR